MNESSTNVQNSNDSATTGDLTPTVRRVVTNIALSLDGRYAKPDNPLDMSWVMPYAVGEVARNHLTGLWSTAGTALLGRVNAEGFLGFWPSVIGMEGADPRDVGFAKWLVDTDKVVLSSTLVSVGQDSASQNSAGQKSVPWDRTTIVNKPAADVVDELADTGDGDILVLSSASVIKALLAADKVDRLAVTLFPVILGGGPRLFDDGLPSGAWRLSSENAGDDGTLALIYDRIR